MHAQNGLRARKLRSGRDWMMTREQCSRGHKDFSDTNHQEDRNLDRSEHLQSNEAGGKQLFQRNWSQ